MVVINGIDIDIPQKEVMDRLKKDPEAFKRILRVETGQMFYIINFSRNMIHSRTNLNIPRL